MVAFQSHSEKSEPITADTLAEACKTDIIGFHAGRWRETAWDLSGKTPLLGAYWWIMVGSQDTLQEAGPFVYISKLVCIFFGPPKKNDGVPFGFPLTGTKQGCP